MIYYNFLYEVRQTLGRKVQNELTYYTRHGIVSKQISKEIIWIISLTYLLADLSLPKNEAIMNMTGSDTNKMQVKKWDHVNLVNFQCLLVNSCITQVYANIHTKADWQVLAFSVIILYALIKVLGSYFQWMRYIQKIWWAHYPSVFRTNTKQYKIDMNNTAHISKITILRTTILLIEPLAEK